MAMPTDRLATMASAGSRRLTTWTGTTGSATRVSTHTAAASRTRPPPTIAAVGHEIQSNSPPTKVTHSSSRLTPAAMRLAPA